MSAAAVTVLAVLLLASQTTLCPLITILGVHPDVVMGTVASIGLLYGRIPGMVAGMLCGLWLDALFPTTFGGYSLFYSFCGFISGSWINTAGERRWWSAHLDSILGDRTWMGRWRSDRVLRPFICAALPAALMKLIFAAIVYIMGMPMNVPLIPVQCLAAGGIAGVLAVLLYPLCALIGPKTRRGMLYVP